MRPPPVLTMPPGLEDTPTVSTDSPRNEQIDSAGNRSRGNAKADHIILQAQGIALINDVAVLAFVVMPYPGLKA